MYYQMQQILGKRPLYTLDRKAFIETNSRLLWLAALIFVGALLVRSWKHYLYPGFYVEDASYYFWINYGGEFKWEHLFRNPNGYFNIFNNFIAQLIGQFDIRYQARAYLAVASFITITTVVMLSRSGLVKNRFLLLVTPLVLGLSGMNHIHYYTTITFQMYVVVIALLVVLLWEPEQQIGKNILILISIPILIFSGPYSVLAVPFAVGFLVLFRGKSLIMVWAIIVTIAYALTTTGSVGSGVVPGNIFGAKTLSLWFETVVVDVLFMGLRGNANIEKVMLIAAVIGPPLYLIRRDTVQVRILLLLMVIIVVTPAPLLLTSKFKLYGGVFPCHVLTAQIAWILFILILLDRLIERVTVSYRSAAGIAAMAVITLFVVADNLKHPRKGNHEILYNTREFLETIKKYETSGLEEKNQRVVIMADGMGIFDPTIKVGSTRPDAKTVDVIYIPRREPEK